MKKHLLILLLALTFGFQINGFSQQVQFWKDDFESSGPSSGTRTTGGIRTDGTNSVITPGGTFNSYFKQITKSTSDISQYGFTEFEGDNYWAGEDHDGYIAVTPQMYLSYSINVEGLTELSFSGMFAALNNANIWEDFTTTNPDYIIVEYALDGGSFSPLLAFRAISSLDKRLAVDADFDGYGDLDGTVLSTSFANFTKAIPGTGNTLTLRIRAFSNQSNEEWGVDNLALSYTPSCTAPTISANPPNRTLCSGGNTTFKVTATGATAYQWQVDQTGNGTFIDLANGGVYSNVTTNTLSITGVTPAMNRYRYRAVAINGTGSCFTNSNYGTLSVFNIDLSASTLTRVTCNGGNDGTITVIPSGGVAPYTYSWSGGITTSTRTNLPAGSYTVTVTDDIGCTVSKNFLVLQYSALVATASPTHVTTPGGSNGAITMTISGGGGGYTYIWNDGTTTKDRTNLSAGNYSVSVKDAAGCTKVVNVTITEPQATTVSTINRASVNPTMQATVDYTITFAASVTGVDATDFELISTGTATGTVGTPTGSGATWTVPITNISGDGTLKLNFTSLTGVTPNISSAFTSGETYTVDNTSPTVVSVTGVDGTYKLGDEVLITVHFSESVKLVSGNPLLTMAVGGNATYQSGNGTDAFVFKYIVAQDVESNDLDYYHEGSFVGGSIADLADNPLIRALPARGATGSLSANANIRIDAKGPLSPSNLAATVGNLKTILTWNPNHELDLAAYKVYGGTSANPTTLLQTITDGTATFTHSGLADGTTYFYRISAVDDLGNEGAASDDVTSIAQTLSANANLSNLTLSLGSLTPGFDSNTTNYSLSVGKNIGSLTITPTQDHPYAALQVRVNAGSYATVVSGNPSASLSLNEGANPIDVLVTAQDGSTKTYTITITRAGLGTPLTNHVVISEIYAWGGSSGATYDRDWVELYNPTNADINLANHWLLYSSAVGSNLGAKIALSGIIPKHGYYLIAPATSAGVGAALPRTPDASGTLLMSYLAGRVALVNTPVTLMPQPGSSEVIDFVGYGSTATSYESTRAVTPNTSSLERKAIANADAITMAIGGADEFKGNGYDSDNNGVDFVLSSPNPQHSSSAVEALVSGNGPTAVALTSGSINENVIAGTTVGTLSTTDADAGDQFTYTLISGTGDTDNAAFAISGDELKINNSPDFETKSSYNIRIRTTDALGLYYEKDFTITINDVTELPQITIAGNMNATTAVYGNASASQTFTVSGANMSEGIVITPPTGFELSLDNTTFTPTVTTGAAGTIADAPIYIRLSASANAGSYGGDISATSTGATTATLNMPSSEVKLSRRFVTMTGAGTKDGSSWANAADDLAAALTASTSGVEVWVAKGTYKPTATTDRAVYFQLNNGVSVYGGFAGTETAVSQRNFKLNPTILSGDIGALGINTDNSYHLFYVANNSLLTTLDGFTIRDGYALGAGVTSGHTTAGAGLYLFNVRNLVLKNLIFTENTSLNEGGAVFLEFSSAGNNAITFSQVSFIKNKGLNYGGGGLSIFGTKSGTVSLDRCIFDGNKVETVDGTIGTGGALQLAATGTVATLANCLFVNNMAGGKNDDGGGAIMNYEGTVNLINSTLYNNSTSSTVSLNGNSVANIAPGVTNITNSIIWGNAAKHLSKPSGTLNLINSLVKGETVSAPNLNSDPLFLNTASLAGADGILGTVDDGLNLRYSSPAKDVASAMGAPVLDITGTSRPLGNGIDMGAYETNAPQPLITATTLSGLSAVYGATPTAGSFTVSGTGMDAGILVTAPTNFEVSTSSTTGFADAITVGSDGEISSTVYVRLKSGLTAGDYAGDITLSSIGATSKNVAASCTITKTPLTIVAGDVTKTYGQALSNLNAANTFVATGLLPGESIGTVSITYVAGAAAKAGVGTYENAVSPANATGGTFNAANYDITYTSGTITVNPAPLTITVNNLAKLYGDVLTGTSGSTAFTAAGLKNDETIGSVTITYGAGSVATAAVNNYDGSIVASAATGGTFVPANYTLSYEAGTIAVVPVALLIIPSHVNKIYGTTLTDGATATGFSTIGLKNDEAIGSVHLAYGAGANASAALGSYSGTVIPSDASGGTFNAQNYNLGYIAGDLDVVAPTIAISPSTLPDATIGVSYSQLISASGGTAGYSYVITAGALPPGLTLATDGTLSGTPTVDGTFNFTITARDSSTGSGPFSGSRGYSIAVQAPTIAIAPATLPDATVGVDYSQTISATGGIAGYTYAITVGALPPGLTLATDGTLSGTPTVDGTFNFTITARDSSTGSSPFSGSRGYTIAVEAPTIAIAPASLPDATVGVGYSQTISATGGIAGYTYAITAGALPPGLTLATNGTLSGTPTAGGTYNFTLTATDSSTGSSPFSGSRGYTIAVQAPTITVAPASLPGATVGVGYSQTISATGGTAGYTYAHTAGAFPPGMSLTTNGTINGIPSVAGTFNFTLTVRDSSTGAGPFSAARSYSITVAIGSQMITFDPLPDEIYGVQPITLTASSSAGLPVTYSSSDNSIASISGNVLTVLKAGSVDISASQVGNSSYNAAQTVTRTLIINKALATIALSDLNQTYDGNSKSITTTTSPIALQGLAITYDGSATVPTAAGTYAVTATLTNDNYSAVAATGNLIIGKAAQSISFAALANRTFNDAPFDLTATGGASGNTVTYMSSNTNVATVIGNKVTIVGAGTTKITASQAGNTNYNAAVDIEQTLTVGKAGQVITFATLADRTFNDAPFDLTATGGASGNAVTYTSSNANVATVIGNKVTIVGAGTTKITASQVGNTNYNAAADVEQTLTVGKANQTITFAALSDKIFNDAPFDLTATGGASGNAVTYTSSNTNVATVIGNKVTIAGAGTTKITASQAGNTNYNAAADVEQTLTVGKANQAITFAALADRTFNDAPFDLTATGGASGNAVTYTSSDTNVATVNNNKVTIVGAGTAKITASQAGNSNYNPSADVEQTLTVGKANQMITFAALPDRTFNDAPFDLTATGGASGNAITYASSNTNVATISGNKVTIVGAGTAKITASQAGNANYNPSADVEQTLTVGKANQAIIFAALSDKTFNDAPFDLLATGGASGNAIIYTSSNTNVATISGNKVTIVGAGTTIITASQAGNTNYNAAVDIKQTLTVGKAGQVITFAALADRTFNDAPFDLMATGGASGNAITYTSSNTNVATISENRVTIVGAGTAKITASQEGNANYDAAADVEQTLTVGKAAQSISFAALPDRTFNDAPFDILATGGASGNAVTYASSNTNVATVAGNKVTIVGAGTTIITASQAGNANYNPSADVEQTLTVGKANQTITFAALADRTFNDTPFDLMATGGASGNLVTYTSSNTNVATISGNRVTIVGAGTAKITASQAGNTNYNPSADVEQTLTVGKAAQSISFAALADRTFNDAPFDLTATGGASGNAITYASSNTNVATISGNKVTIVGAGTTKITASQAGNTNYNAAADVEQTLTVGKANQTITFAALSDKTFNDAPFDLTATGGASGNAVTYTSSNTNVATVIGNKVTIAGAGTTKITASQEGNTNYNAAVDIEQTLTVGKAGQVITFAALADRTFNDAPFDLTAAGGASGNAVTYTSSDTNVATISGNKVTIVGAGTTKITASQAGNTNYNAAADVEQTLTVGKANQAITFAALADRTFNDAPFDLTATGGASGNAVTYASSDTNVATVTNNKVTIVGAGTAKITASQEGNANYNPAADVEQMLNVGKANQTITFAALADRTFNDAPFDLTATGGASGNAITYASSDTNVATINGNKVTIVGAGTAKITASQAGNANYKPSADVEQTLTVGKAAQSISFAALANRTFGDAPFDLTATGGASGNAVTYTSSNTSVATVIGNKVTIVGAGTTKITASQAGNANYNAAADVEQTFTVGKAAQSISFAALANRTFGDAPFDLTATGGASGNVVTYTSSNTSVATVTSNKVTIVGAGTTKITASQAGNANYNAAADIEQMLTVGKAAQSISFAALADKTFNDAPFDLTATGGASGNAVTYTSSNTSVATVTNNKVTIVGAGTTIITASQEGNANYNPSADVEQALTVGNANQTITFAALADRTFNDAPFNLTATGGASGNTVTYTSSNTSVATVTGNKVTIVGAGTAIITASQAGNANYNAAADVEQTLTVGKATQSISFAALANRTFNDAPFDLTATGGASGNAITYASSNTNVATISGNKVTIVGAGTAIITASQAGNTNYNPAADVEQTLTVGKAAQSISFADLPEKYYGDLPFNLNAKAGTTGNTVSYTSSNPSVAVINGDVVTITGVGSTTISAMQAGNNNYLAATEVNQNLTVLQKPVTANFTITSKVYDGSTVATISNNTLTGVVAADLGEVSLTGSTAVYNDKNAGTNKTVNINGFVLSGAKKDNYILTNTNATSTGTIIPKDLTITADDKEKLQGLQLPNFTAKYDGFIPAETAADLSAQPVFSTTATASSPQGSYSIIVNGATAVNYSITFVDGVLKVKPGLPTNINFIAQTLLENAPVGTNAGTLNSTSDDPNATFQYSLVSGSGDADNNLFAIAGNQLRTTASLNYEVKATYSIRVRSTNQYGLSIEQSFVLSLTDVNEVPTLNEIANQTICFTTTQQNIPLTGITAGGDANQTVSLSLSSTNSALFESLSLSPLTGSNAQLRYTPAKGANGSATITITVTDNGGVANGGINTYTRTFTIHINALPVPTISASTGTTISKGATVVLTASGGVNYQWSNANGIISGQNTALLTVRPSETTTYRVVVSNASGCQEVKEITIEVNSDFQLISGTNLLSPNGDGKNDRLIIRNLDLYPNNELKIFDRAGRILYSKKNYNNEWDGTFNGLPLAEGTYYYIIDFGQKVGVKKGFISIVRD